MEFVDVFWGFWNGLTAWIVLVVHVFGGWPEYPIFDITRDGNWYAFGFLLGAGSPLLGALSGGSRQRVVIVEREPAEPVHA